MKNTMKSLTAILILLLTYGGLQAQDAKMKTEKFKVYGNCGMCEDRIEKAAKSVDGVSQADWDKETKMIEVSLDTEKTEMMEIHKAIAAVGHDTEKMEAEDKDYSDLPECCQYKRKAHHSEDKEHHDHKH